MTEENRFIDVTDDEIRTRLKLLVDEYEDLVPEVIIKIREWAKLKRELKVLSEEAKNRNME